MQSSGNKRTGRSALPASACQKKSLWAFLTSCFQNCKMDFCSMILQFCRCGGLFNAKGNPDGFLSHFPSLRDLRLGRFFGSLKRTGHSDLPAFSYVLCLLLRHCGRSDQSCRTAASSFPAHACSSACGFCAAEIGQNGSNSVTGWNNMQNAQVIRLRIVQNRKLNF